MALATGTRLGPYEVLAFIGAGGIGEVYRARDTKLGREIAIKTLRDAFVHDRAHLARFKREAQLLAALNHPNIGAIYNFEESNGLQYLVLELVPGKTLAELLAVGPLDLQKGLSACRQVAAALEAAHEKGLVHRDLKPANVKVTPEGKVKVLDFGLAKGFAENAESDPPSESSSTIGSASTMQGAILGTASYMSPEQARGQKVDKRTDIWSFGCVLYETLTGRRAFAGSTVSDTIAMILGREPDWQALPVATPAEVISLLRRCLQKDASRRLRDMGDAGIEIDEASASSSVSSNAAPVTAGPAARRKFRPIAWVLTILAAIGVGGVLRLLLRPAPATPPTARVAIALPPGDQLALGPSPVISSDGSHLVYAAIHSGGIQLYLRSMDRFDAAPIPGTQDAENPFFSPDGQSVGFFAGGKLKTVSLNGGMPLTLCGAPENRGGSWSPDNTIIFSPSSAVGLYRVSAAGGAPQPLTALAAGELSHRWPEVLPGGKAVLFTIWTGASFDDAQIGVQSLETGEQRVLVKGGTDAKYVSSGHLIYAHAGGLLA
ncbi:MAG TPA: protein kinase, partial [Candidatus Sulfotelmatobacter sp.]|nr:protein kinase [Candidatus Sulfotelmatobacter sp.]